MEFINWSAAKLLFDVLQALFMGVMAIYIYWLNKHRASQTAIRSIDKRIDGVEKQVVKLEHQVEGLPDHADLTKLQEQVAKTNLLLAEVSTSQKAMSAQVDRMNDYLMNHRGSR